MDEDKKVGGECTLSPSLRTAFSIAYTRLQTLIRAKAQKAIATVKEADADRDAMANPDIQRMLIDENGRPITEADANGRLRQIEREWDNDEAPEGEDGIHPDDGEQLDLTPPHEEFGPGTISPITGKPLTGNPMGDLQENLRALKDQKDAKTKKASANGSSKKPKADSKPAEQSKPEKIKASLLSIIGGFAYVEDALDDLLHASALETKAGLDETRTVFNLLVDTRQVIVLEGVWDLATAPEPPTIPETILRLVAGNGQEKIALGAAVANELGVSVEKVNAEVSAMLLAGQIRKGASGLLVAAEAVPA